MGISTKEFVVVLILTIGLFGGLYLSSRPTNIKSEAKKSSAECNTLSKSACIIDKKNCDWKESCKKCVKKDGACNTSDDDGVVPTCASIGYAESGTCTISGPRENGIYCRLKMADRKPMYCCKYGWKLVNNTCIVK